MMMLGRLLKKTPRAYAGHVPPHPIPPSPNYDSPEEADKKANGPHRNPVTYALLFIAVVPLALMYFYIQPVMVDAISCAVGWWMAVSLCSFFVYLFRNVRG
jgi:hypothetical protein